MAVRGIQVLGLFLAAIILLGLYIIRRIGRLKSRSFIFWVSFWSLFVIVDIYPSLTGYFTPYFDLGKNMYTLTAISIMVLFVFVFVISSYLSDLNYKLNKLIREQAITEWRRQYDYDENGGET